MTKGFVSAFCLAMLISAPSFADTVVCRTIPSPKLVRHHARHTTHTARAKHCDEAAREAEQELSDLGYYTGAVDCITGPALRDAIKRFQRDHGLKADGKLGPKTRAALRKAAHEGIGSHASNNERTGRGTGSALGQGMGWAGTGSGGPIDDDYVTRMNDGTKSLDTRFGRVDVTETDGPPNLRYAVSVNGAPVLNIDGQPAVISVSPVYDMGDEQAVVFGTYDPNNATCMFTHHVLAMTSGATQMLDLDNCTRRVDAQVVKGALVITLPERGSDRALGATWTLHGMELQKL